MCRVSGGHRRSHNPADDAGPGVRGVRQPAEGGGRRRGVFLACGHCFVVRLGVLSATVLERWSSSRGGFHRLHAFLAREITLRAAVGQTHRYACYTRTIWVGGGDGSRGAFKAPPLYIAILSHQSYKCDHAPPNWKDMAARKMLKPIFQPILYKYCGDRITFVDKDDEYEL